MTMPTVAIERLAPPASKHDLAELAALLVDAVDAGAAVSFLAPLAHDAALAWWRNALANAHPRAVILVARDAHGIVGTAQLQPAWAPNQPHRAEVAKVLVHRRGQRSGIGRRLMERIEVEARRAGFTLLTLDARKGGAAEELYRRAGWTYVGTIPDYALDTDGRALHDTVVYYRRLVVDSADSR
jgi:ribosomal protein S18 acetylase RimI-like enzyme